MSLLLAPLSSCSCAFARACLCVTSSPPEVCEASGSGFPQRPIRTYLVCFVFSQACPKNGECQSFPAKRSLILTSNQTKLLSAPMVQRRCPQGDQCNKKKPFQESLKSSVSSKANPGSSGLPPSEQSLKMCFVESEDVKNRKDRRVRWTKQSEFRGRV